MGSYSYGAGNAGPHAVTSAGGQTYAYDANGNNISGDGRTISYTSFDKPSQIIKGSHKVEFEYGPDRSRYRRIDTNTGNGRVTDTLYIGSVEKITNPDGSKEWKRTIGNIVIKQVFNSSGTQTAKSEHYIFKDHLGSPSLIMDKVAQVQQTMDFDPWGARRTTNWAAMSSTELTNTFFKNHSISNSVGTDSMTSRGFTGHEMLDEVGIIHMNGRIYDAKLGRFLQADPIIQAPYDTQSLNRYAYTRNNPLNAVDPTGYFFSLIVGIITAIIQVDLTLTVIAVGLAAFAEAMVMGGSFGDALLAGLSAGALTFSGINLFPGFEAGIGKMLLYGAQMGVIGGITSAIQGGKFGHGFISAGFGSFVGAKVGNFVKGANTALTNMGKFLAKVTVGGTISKVTGGKFGNGAGYAAFSAAVSYAATTEAVAAESSNGESIKKVENLPDKIEDRQSIYDEGLSAAKTQGLNIDGAKIEPKLGTIHLRSRAGFSKNFSSKADALQYLSDNPKWFAADGVYYGNGNISIYATAVSASKIYLPNTDYISSRLYKFSIYGRGFSRNLTPVENVIQTISHETGHYLGQGHYWDTGDFGQIHREFDSIATHRGL